MIAPSSVQHAVLRRCRELGFALAGIADASPTRYGAELRAWLADGRHGSMAYLAENLDERLDPGRLLPDARSVIMVADLYAPRGSAQEPAPGRIARYAAGATTTP
jgi:epoxyqueuosine reductase